MEQLQHWIESLSNIPVSKGWQRSLMDITGVTHHENMWSDIYSFFFNPVEEHGLNDLFIRSFEQLIGIKSNFLNDFRIVREYVAENNNRIDLLLIDRDNPHAIIIENKVNHSLSNDLNLYYQTVQKKSYNDVKVVVLGLKKYELKGKRTSDIAQGNIFSITHIDLLNQVMSNLPNYEDDVNPHHLYLLQEFYKNIKNITNMVDQKELAFFCHEGNMEKIVRVHDIYRHIRDYVVTVMECGKNSLLRNRIMSLELRPKPERDYVKYVFTDKRAKDQMMLTVFYRKNILRPEHGQCPHISVVLEIQNSLMEIVKNNISEYNRLVEMYKADGVIPSETKGKNWWHYARMVIPLNNLEEDLPRLAEIVSSVINKECPLLKLGDSILNSI